MKATVYETIEKIIDVSEVIIPDCWYGTVYPFIRKG